jgi:hypothetical protein
MIVISAKSLPPFPPTPLVTIAAMLPRLTFSSSYSVTFLLSCSVVNYNLLIICFRLAKIYQVYKIVFLDRNLDTSQPSGPRDPAPPLLRRLRPGSTSAQVCSGLLTHLTRNRQLLTRSPKRPPSPARGPKSVPTVRSFPDSYPGLPVFMRGTFFCLQVVLRHPLRFASGYVFYK